MLNKRINCLFKLFANAKLLSNFLGSLSIYANVSSILIFLIPLRFDMNDFKAKPIRLTLSDKLFAKYFLLYYIRDKSYY